MTRYLIQYTYKNNRKKTFECWKVGDQWVTDGYSVLDEENIIIIRKLGTPHDIFNLSNFETINF